MIAGIAAIILIFGASRQLGPKLTRTMLGLSALALLGFAFYQLWMGLEPTGGTTQNTFLDSLP